MNPAIATGLTPPRPGLEREEPELTHEDDIPPDDGTVMPPDELPAEHEEQPLRQVERE
jgi:hypothetical protein